MNKLKYQIHSHNITDKEQETINYLVENFITKDKTPTEFVYNFKKLITLNFCNLHHCRVHDFCMSYQFVKPEPSTNCISLSIYKGQKVMTGQPVLSQIFLIVENKNQDKNN